MQKNTTNTSNNNNKTHTKKRDGDKASEEKRIKDEVSINIKTQLDDSRTVVYDRRCAPEYTQHKQIFDIRWMCKRKMESERKKKKKRNTKGSKYTQNEQEWEVELTEQVNEKELKDDGTEDGKKKKNEVTNTNEQEE